MMINLTFEAFDVEAHPSCDWDWVEVSYGSFNQKFCGSSIPGSFVSETPITVKFHSDESVKRSGFTATWTATTTTTTFESIHAHINSNTTTTTTTTTTKTVNMHLECPDYGYILNGWKDFQFERNVKSWPACSQQCQDRQDCGHWVWYKEGHFQHFCVTMTSYTSKYPSSGTVAGDRDCQGNMVTNTLA